MRGQSKIGAEHRSKKAYVYVRQSSMKQVMEHPESGRRQRDFAQWVQSLGWPASEVVVLDSDQGKSGQSSSEREAFKRLAGEVSSGEVGMVVSLYLSRLARNNADWFPLIEMCGLTRSLIADEEGIYDPNDPNDRLLLGLKGTLSEAEAQRIRSQLHGARWSKAHRGELRRRLPVGYAYDERGQVVMDPDERVRHALRSFFERFEDIGSACGVARTYSREGLLFPTRWYRGTWDSPVRWARLGVRRATSVLHNPFYAGAYFYGERRSRTRLNPKTRARTTILEHLPMDKWEVLIQDAHPAYIPWGRFVRNQQKLRENWSMLNSGPRAVRSGASLLQGLVYCGRCARQMRIQYRGRHAYPVYVCARRTEAGESQYCSAIPAGKVDPWVEEELLAALQPSGIEAALEATAELERRSEALKREWEHRIEQGEYEAQLARRRYEAVDPDNRLVAGNLERDWEERLREVERLRQEYAQRAMQPPIWIRPADREKVRELARDIPRLWRLKSTKQSDRKKIVRLLVQDIWLAQEDDPRRIRIQVHWNTGAVTEGTVARPLPLSHDPRTPADVVERIRHLYAAGQSYEEIAEQLNREGLRTARNMTFTARRVDYLIRSRKMNKERTH
jgi:DNA invertase Pin-like site-specific DNA recombinase